MATSEYWQRVTASVSSSEWANAAKRRASRGTSKFWMVLDALTVFGAAGLATLYEFKMSPIVEVRSFWRGTLIHGRSMGILLTLMLLYRLPDCHQPATAPVFSGAAGRVSA